MFKSTLAIVLLATVATVMSRSLLPSLLPAQTFATVGNLTTWALSTGYNGSQVFDLFFLNVSPDNQTNVPFTLWQVLPQSSDLAARFSVQDRQLNRTLVLGVNQTTSISVTPWELAVWNVTGLLSN